MNWFPPEQEGPERDPWAVMPSGQAPDHHPAREGEPMCETCESFVGGERKCKQFGVDTNPFDTCAKHSALAMPMPMPMQQPGPMQQPPL